MTCNRIAMITLALRSTHLMINTSVYFCLSYALISKNVLKLLIPITSATGNCTAIIIIVIVQYPSYNEHICAMLFIISYDKLICT